jgi:hypothetical protein
MKVNSFILSKSKIESKLKSPKSLIKNYSAKKIPLLIFNNLFGIIEINTFKFKYNISNILIGIELAIKLIEKKYFVIFDLIIIDKIGFLRINSRINIAVFRARNNL